MSSQDKVLPELSSKGNADSSQTKNQLDPKEIMSKLKVIMEASRTSSPQEKRDAGKSPKSPIILDSSDEELFEEMMKKDEYTPPFISSDAESDDSDFGHDDNSHTKPKGSKSTSRKTEELRSPYSPLPEAPKKLVAKNSKKRVSMAGNGDDNIVKVTKTIANIKIEDDTICYTTPTGNVEVEGHPVSYYPEKGATRYIQLDYQNARVFDDSKNEYATFKSGKFNGSFYDINKNSFFPQDRKTGQYEITHPFICYGQIDHPCAPLSKLKKWDNRRLKWRTMSFEQKVMVKSTYYCFLTIVQNPRVFQVQPELYQVIFLYAGTMYNFFDHDHDRFDNYGFDLLHNLAHLAQPQLDFIFEYLKIFENQFWIAYNQMLDSEVELDSLSYYPVSEIEMINRFKKGIEKEKAENQYVFFEIAKEYATEFVQFYQPDGTPKFKENEQHHVPDKFVKNYNMYNDKDTTIPFPAISMQQSKKFEKLFLATFEGVRERLGRKLEKVFTHNENVDKSMISAYVKHFTDKINPEQLFKNTEGSKHNYDLFTLVMNHRDGSDCAKRIMDIMYKSLKNKNKNAKCFPMNTFSCWFENHLQRNGFRKLPTDHPDIQPAINALADFICDHKVYTIFFNRFGVIYPRIQKENHLYLPNQIIRDD